MMAEVFMSFCLLLLLPLPASAQRLGALNQVIDLGQVPFNQPITAEFELVNKSDKNISIVKVRSSCGCTTVNYPKDPIRKGGELTVSATYDARQLGHFFKQVALYTDQDEQPFKLTLKGIVVDTIVNYTGKYDYMLGELSADRKTVSFDDVNAGDQPTAKIHIMNPTQKAAQPVVMHLPAYLKADVSPSKLAPGQAGTITLTLASEELSDYGLTQTPVYLGMNPGERVSHDKEIVVTAVLLPSFADYTDDDYAYAPKLHLSVGEGTVTTLPLGSFNGKKKLKGEVYIINEGMSELEISQLQMYTPGIQLSLDKSHLAPDEITTLHVAAVAKDYRPEEGRQPGILMITNDPHRPKVTINIDIK